MSKLDEITSSARLWREVRRHWTAGGVLGALVLAVLAPRLGATGEVSVCAPLLYVYYVAGRRWGARALWQGLQRNARLHALGAAHAHLVTPAICAALVTALRDGVDYRIVKGVVAVSRGGGCAWLALALCARPEAATLAALVAALAPLAAPLASALLCGRASLPLMSSVLYTLGTSTVPFVVGLCRASFGTASETGGGSERALRLCALVLLYAECCERLTDAEGPLLLTDVLVTLFIEWCAVCGSAGACALYAHYGVLTPEDARVLAICAVPRATDVRREWGVGCVAGLARLPAVFAAPAQALLLAALAPDDVGIPIAST